ncbi:MAG: Ig domain-containing protein, partial [Bacteroidales bacterium]|nr:Ig domain-containing protein [Bacteroidales bacterium]
MVTGVAEGTATIAVSTNDGGFTASSNISVIQITSHTFELEVISGWNYVNRLQIQNGDTWVEINDTDPGISYTNWIAHSGGWHESQTAGATAEYTFTGTGIRLYGNKASWGGTGNVYIDGAFNQVANFGGNASDVLILEITGLTGGEPDVPVTGVDLTGCPSADMTIGQAVTLTANVLPVNATNPSVTWSSSNTAVATVSYGTVTAVGIGAATITVTTVDGGYTATCAITVAPIHPTSVSITNCPSANLALGATHDLNEAVLPANATNKTVSWSSSNTSVATVNTSGLV